MKFCPMCGTSNSESENKVCWLCDYEEKPLSEITEREFFDLMAPYEYEMIEDGVRITAVKNGRDIALRGSVGIPHFVTEIMANTF